MAGISRDRHEIELLEAADFLPVCMHCDIPARRGFYWRASIEDVAICKECIPAIIAAMIFDAVREENFHVTWNLVKPISERVEQGLRRISDNLDRSFLNGDGI